MWDSVVSDRQPVVDAAGCYFMGGVVLSADYAETLPRVYAQRRAAPCSRHTRCGLPGACRTDLAVGTADVISGAAGQCVWDADWQGKTEKWLAAYAGAAGLSKSGDCVYAGRRISAGLYSIGQRIGQGVRYPS